MSSDVDVMKIKQDRFIKQDPYAHIDGDGNLSALPPLTTSIEASSREIGEDRLLLGNPYAHLDGNGSYSALKRSKVRSILEKEELNPIPKQYYSDNELEELAQKVQLQIWRNRNSLWIHGAPSNPIEILNPEFALKAMGFDFELAETLGQFQQGNQKFEVAGTINKKSKLVQISRQFPIETRRFTAAHELAHAILHASNGLHRDKPIDGPSLPNRLPTEIQADKFAAYFLMPKKLVRKIFKELFLAEKFLLNEETAFALGYEYEALRIMSSRELARLLAKTEKFNFKNFKSLATQFYVSEEAMAIRLEELELITLS